jgi:tetrahydromethanopterin S-methyltransferase subunit G
MNFSPEFAVQIATYIGTFGVVYGGLSSRLRELEKKMDKHNSLIERMYAVETTVKEVCKKVDKIETKLDYKGAYSNEH